MLALGTNDDLGAPTPNVDKKRLSVAYVDATGHPEVNQPCFFWACDHTHIELRLVLEAGDKDLLIVRFACGSRRHGDDLVRPMGACEPGKLLGDQHGPRHGLRLQVPMGKFAFPEAYHLFELSQNRVRMVR